MELRPIVSRADGEEVVGQLIQFVEWRLILIHIHLNIVCDAGTEEINYRIALSAIGIVQLYRLILYNTTVAVLRGDVQYHLGAVVPYAANLVGIVPRHADGVGLLVFPLGSVVRNAQ